MNNDAKKQEKTRQSERIHRQGESGVRQSPLRHGKLSNVTNDIVEEVKKNLNEEFLGSRGYYKELKKEYKEKIRLEAQIVFGDMVREELDLMRSEIKVALRNKKDQMVKEIDNINLEKIIAEVAEKVIYDKLRR